MPPRSVLVLLSSTLLLNGCGGANGGAPKYDEVELIVEYENSLSFESE
jgi:hypothetical protein